MTLTAANLWGVATEGAHEVPVIDPGAASGVFSLMWLVIALPAAGAVVLLLGGALFDKAVSRWGHLLGVATVLGSFAVSLAMFVGLLGRDESQRQVGQHLFTWFEAGRLNVGMDLLYDQLSALFLLLITGVGSLIHIYSVGYMEHDPRRRRFFGYLNLFVAAMLILVLAGNYVGVFLGWRASAWRRTSSSASGSTSRRRPLPPRRPSSSTGWVTSG